MSDIPLEPPYIPIAEQARLDPRTNAELIREALVLPQDDDERWSRIWILHDRGTRDIFEAASNLVESNDPRERQLGVDILGQNGVKDKAFHQETVELLIGLLAKEENTNVLWSTGIALGHRDDPRAIEPLSKLKNHPHEDVRYGVVLGVSGHVDPIAIQTLIELSADVDDNVRDWASFGLGTILNSYAGEIPPEIDIQAIRDALYARVTDHHDDTRGEALMGLAMWRDSRVVEPLINELSVEDAESIGMLALEAATESGDPRLCEALLRLENRWQDEPDRFLEEVQKAIVACGCQPGSTATDESTK